MKETGPRENTSMPGKTKVPVSRRRYHMKTANLSLDTPIIPWELARKTDTEHDVLGYRDKLKHEGYQLMRWMIIADKLVMARNDRGTKCWSRKQPKSIEEPSTDREIKQCNSGTGPDHKV